MVMSESLRNIRLFVATYEERSFTAAAQREHATQSGVSQHIRNLEERLGVQLFVRSRGGIAPTPAGDAYYVRCVELLRLVEEADAAAQRFDKGLTGEIFVGLMPTMTRSALAPALSRFTRDHPNVAVRIVEAYSAVLTQQIRSGELDFAIVPALPATAGVSIRPFLRTIELLVSNRNVTRDHLAPLRLKDQGHLKLVVPGQGNTRRRSIEIYLASNGVTYERLLELDAMLGTLDFVSRSDWVTILPGIMMASDIEQHSVTINPIIDPVFFLDLVMIEPSRRSMSAPARMFLDILAEESLRLDEPWTEYLGGKAGARPASRKAGSA